MLLLNGYGVPTGKFPNRETYIGTDRLEEKLLPDRQIIQMHWEDNDDLMNLMLLKGTLDDMGVGPVDLFIPYFPYSTMDHTDGSKSLSLRYVAAMVNGMKFRTVYVAEPHSSVVMALVDRVQQVGVMDRLVKRAMDTILDAVKDPGRPVFCFPDLGAAKRYAGRIGKGYQTLTFEKDRDFATGKILGMRCIDQIPDGENCYIILDDLCRRGGTFMMCADLLRKAGAKYVALCVVHTENGASNGVLKKDSPVDRVFTTDSCSLIAGAEKLDLIKWRMSDVGRRPVPELV